MKPTIRCCPGFGRTKPNELRVSAALLPPRKLGWTERGGGAASGGMLWNFQLSARAWGLGLPVGPNGRGRGRAPSRWSGGVIRGGGWRFRGDETKAGERQAKVGRGLIGARWDESGDDCCGNAITVMVRMPVSGKGGRRERDGAADSMGRSVSHRMVCDWRSIGGAIARLGG